MGVQNMNFDNDFSERENEISNDVDTCYSDEVKMTTRGMP